AASNCGVAKGDDVPHSSLASRRGSELFDEKGSDDDDYQVRDGCGGGIGLHYLGQGAGSPAGALYERAENHRRVWRMAYEPADGRAEFIGVCPDPGMDQ